MLNRAILSREEQPNEDRSEPHPVEKPVGMAHLIEGRLPTVPVDGCKVSSVRIDSLILDTSPRLDGEDPEHIRLLAETNDSLPPIIVHRATMRVIDGLHRVRAALMNGRTFIDARLVDCDDNSAFVLAVTANITHGLPLSQSDRKAAASRIVVTQPGWSDRAIAVATGLSNKTVAAIRARTTGENPQLTSRRGRDGRQHPVNTAARRRRAAAMLDENPGAALREIARATGLSPATVRDVRQRNERGEDPVPPRYRTTKNGTGTGANARPGTRSRRSRNAEVPGDERTVLAKLSNDPSLRFNDAGRQAVRWLHRHVIDSESLNSVGSSVPDHWAVVVAKLARSCAMHWAELADELEKRAAAKTPRDQ